MLLDVSRDRKTSSRVAILRPVECEAARNTGTSRTGQRRFQHIPPIEELVAVCFIQAKVDVPAQFRQNHETKKFVLQVDRLPNRECLLCRRTINSRKRIQRKY